MVHTELQRSKYEWQKSYRCPNMNNRNLLVGFNTNYCLLTSDSVTTLSQTIWRLYLKITDCILKVFLLYIPWVQWTYFSAMTLYLRLANYQTFWKERRRHTHILSRWLLSPFGSEFSAVQLAFHLRHGSGSWLKRWIMQLEIRLRC